MDQGRQGRDQVDTAVVQDVRGQRRAAPASCARLQSWQLSPHACNTGADQGLVADELEGEADQDRREGGEPRTLRRLPNGGGRHPTTNVPGDSAADRGTTAATTTRASMKRLIVTRSSAIDRRNASSNLLLPEQPANRSTFLRTLSPANAGLSLRPSTHRWVRGNSCRLSDASLDDQRPRRNACALGRAAHPWRVAQARFRGGSADRRQVHGQDRRQPVRSELGYLPAQPYATHRSPGFVRGPGALTL